MRRWPVIAVILSILAGGPLASQAGADESGPDIYVNGLVDLASAFGEDGLPHVNEFRRSDSPFDAMRLTLFADVVFSKRLSLLNQIILAPTSRSSVSSFLRIYVRYTAFVDDRTDLHIEAGKIPTPFGTFGARAYSNRNVLISIPLMYYYHTSLRANQLPADTADLLNHRGQGHGSRFTGFSGGGSGATFNGLPVVYDPCWDTGVRAIGSLWRFEYQAALTQGTLGDPRNTGGDNNEGQQIAGRVGFVLLPGAVIGMSYAQGPYLDASVAPVLQPGDDVEDFDQKVLGLDLDLGYRHFRVLAEAGFNTWEVPTILDASGNRDALENVTYYVEVKYVLSPGLYAAGRYGEMRFGDIDDGVGGQTPWDNPVRRMELGVGYTFRDGVTGKVVRQDFWEKDLNGTGSYARAGFWGAQFSLYF